MEESHKLDLIYVFQYGYKQVGCYVQLWLHFLSGKLSMLACTK